MVRIKAPEFNLPCVGTLIIILLIVFGISFVVNHINTETWNQYDIPNNPVILCATEREAVSIIPDYNSSNSSSTNIYGYGPEFFKDDTSANRKLIMGDVIVDINDLEIIGTNNYSKPIASAFNDLFKQAKSSNHYRNISQKTTSDDFFTNTSLKNGGAYIATYDDKGEVETRMNIADISYETYSHQKYDGGMSISNYSDNPDPNKVYDVNNCIEFKFSVLSNQLASLDENSKLHIILTSGGDSSSSDYYCYDVVVPVYEWHAYG